MMEKLERASRQLAHALDRAWDHGQKRDLNGHEWIRETLPEILYEVAFLMQERTQLSADAIQDLLVEAMTRAERFFLRPAELNDPDRRMSKSE